LAENGKSSSSKRTRHLNVRYYFITDKIKKGHVKVAFCPTQDMVADFFTKPLQGNLFVRMRKRILNLPASKIASVHRSVLEQRVASPNEAIVKKGKNDGSARVDKTQQTRFNNKNAGRGNKSDTDEYPRK